MPLYNGLRVWLLWHFSHHSNFFFILLFYQRGLTEEMPENVHFCIQKKATHSHFIRSTPF